MHRLVFLLFLLLIKGQCFAQAYSLQTIDTKTGSSFRGMSIAQDNTVWVSGSKGWVARSTNEGKDWTFKQVQGYEQLDFRTLYAFDSAHAVIANAGRPAYVLYTGNGGMSWEKVYENKDSSAFIDGIDFWNRRKGMIHGDPINGRMLVLYTKDGGKSWKELENLPTMNEGEASFAASGTSIQCLGKRTVIIAVGGKTSRLCLSGNRGGRWYSMPTPVLATSASTGIFSFKSDTEKGCWFVAGGDYKNDTLRRDNFFYSTDEGKNWRAPQTTTRGYRECLALLYDANTKKKDLLKAMFAVGPSGIDISFDYGVNWKPLFDDKGFHVAKAAHCQERIFIAGANGKLAIISLKP